MTLKTPYFYGNYRSINKSVICDLECNGIGNVDFCDVTRLQVNALEDKFFLDASFVHGLMWRYFPLGDEFVDVVSFRDADSYILERELDAVRAWLSSDKSAHIMRGIFIISVVPYIYNQIT